MTPTPTTFLITSPGYTATRWLAEALHSHPDVYCNHSAGLVVRERDYYPHELTKLAHEKFTTRDKTPIHTFLQQLSAHSEGSKAVGNVHRYNLTALRRNLAEWPLHPLPNCINLIRHPVPWVASGTAQLKTMFSSSPIIRTRLRRHFHNHKALYLSLSVPPFAEPHILAFCYLCHRFKRLAAEATDTAIDHLRMEDLTRDHNLFRTTMAQLTGLDPDKPATYIPQVFAQGPIHQHTRAKPRSPQQLFSSWPLWKQRVFLHWAQQSQLFERYHTLYQPVERNKSKSTTHLLQRPPLPTKPPQCSLEPIHQALTTSFVPVHANAIDLTQHLEGELTDVLRLLHTKHQLPTPAVTTISPGVEHGVPALIEPSFFTSGGSKQWRFAAYHPYLQDRSPALLGYHPPTHTTQAINLKGAGLRSQTAVSLQRNGRYRAHVPSTVHKPIEILADHTPNDPLGHALLGGARFAPILMEIRNALGWHKLLYALDGRPASTCIPMQLATPTSMFVRQASTTTTLPTWDYLTHPAWTTQAQLRQLLNTISVRHALWPPQRRQLKQFERCLRQSPHHLEHPKYNDLRQTVGELYIKDTVPVVYTYATSGKLRVGHVWELLRSDGAMDIHLVELGLPATEKNALHILQSAMAEIYACNGQVAAWPKTTKETLFTQEGRFRYLENMYHHNRPQADAIMTAVGYAGGRSLGALHGAGGHGLGRRIKVPGHPVGPLGLVRRMGAPGGGCTTPRNMTVCGEWVDTSHLFNPHSENSARLAAFLGQTTLGKTCLPWSHHDYVTTFQFYDVELALESMAQFGALMTGTSTPTFDVLHHIDLLRHQRKQQEDMLYTAPNNQHTAIKRTIKHLEASLRKLRFSCPKHTTHLALTAFKQAYLSYARHARAWCRSR